MIRAALHEKAHAGIPAHSELGLPAMLSAFNRKERLFLLGYASGGLDPLELHAPGLRLSLAFRTNLEAAIDLPVPAHAWAGRRLPPQLAARCRAMAPRHHLARPTQ